MNNDNLTTEDRVTISRFLHTLNLFREIDPNMRLGEIKSFLTVAMNENSLVGEVGRQAGIPTQSVSTYLKTLGEGRDRNGKPAMGLLAARTSPFDARETMVRLTPKGAALADQIRDAMGG